MKRLLAACLSMTVLILRDTSEEVYYHDDLLTQQMKVYVMPRLPLHINKMTGDKMAGNERASTVSSRLFCAYRLLPESLVKRGKRVLRAEEKCWHIVRQAAHIVASCF